MRQCKYRVYDRATRTWSEKHGNWHEWSSDYEEFESGCGNYAVGVVEHDDGSVALPRADYITFLDLPPAILSETI
jgi:hypothetical protein